MPIIDNNSGKVKRSILQVIDVEQEDEVIIDVDEFFSRPSDEIERISRMLSEAAESGRAAYLCGCCRTPVKIAKRDFGNKEVLFFSHCTHDVSCDWKQEHSHTRRGTEEPNGFSNTETYDYKAKYKEIKSLIETSLKTDNSREIGISNVEIDKRLNSKYKFMPPRVACIYAEYSGRKIAFELQTKNVLMGTVVNKDIFCRLNDYNVIWVFGADEGGGYDYINKHTHKNTMFANKRNVFIMDKEAMEACRERQQLVLKCNYLDPDDLWHFRKDTTGTNGILITIEDLRFDEDMCKPYYFDANKEYFKLHPEKEKEYLDGIVSKEKLLKDLQDTWEGKIAERRIRKGNKPKDPHDGSESPIDKPVNIIVPIHKPVLDKRFIEYINRWILRTKGKEGVVDVENTFIIPADYDEIQVWVNGKYRVRQLDQWGVIDEKKNIIVDIKYKEIGVFSNGQALVKTYSEEYYIDEYGRRIPDQSISLPNGWIKYRQGNQWGILNTDGDEIVKCIYDEIGSFRRRLIGFYKGEFQKLPSTRYEYRMPFTCSCSRNTSQRACYVINGVKLLAVNKVFDEVGKLYTNMNISNISYKKRVVYVSKLSPEQESRPYDHVDQDSDFAEGETVVVTVTKIKGKKIFATTDDGRKTYFTKTLVNNHSEIQKGTILTIKKIGFDHDIERTLWELFPKE